MPSGGPVAAGPEHPGAAIPADTVCWRRFHAFDSPLPTTSSADPALGRALLEHPHILPLALIGWHLLFWVLAPLLAYGMAPLDAIELLGWGMEWQGGYYKHPPLGPWLGEIAFQLSGGRIGSLYVLAQLGMAATLAYVWLTARLVLDPARAALATAVLAGSYFHTVLTPNFNMNTLQLPLWVALGYHVLRGLRGARWHWVAAGAAAALLLLAKYSGALLVAVCGLLVLCLPEGRRALREAWPQVLLGIALGLALLSPHLLWLSSHWRLPLEYLGSFDFQSRPGWQAHVLGPLRFGLVSLASPLFAYVLFALVLDRRVPRPRIDRDTWVLLALLLGPLLLAMAWGAFSGSRLKTTWAFPFFSLAGVVLFRLLPTRVDARAMQRFAIGLALVTLFIAGVHLAYKTGSERSKTRFDGPGLALAVQAHWDQAFDTPLRIVAADHILSAMVSQYAPDRPSMLVHGDFTVSTWLTPAQLQRDGAAVLCRGEFACLRPIAGEDREPIVLEVDGERFSLFLRPPAGD